MAKGHKPKAGSRAFWPRKRARRIYPVMKSKKTNIKDAMPLGFAAYKAGMIQISMVDNKKGSATQGQEVMTPVTILDSPSLFVCGIKLYKKTAYGLNDKGIIWANKLEKTLSRKTNVPKEIKPKEIPKDVNDVKLLVHTKPKKSGIGKKRPELFEIPVAGEFEKKLTFAKEKLGNEISSKDVFEEGEFIDVIAIDTGKGFQGPVKRFGIKIRTRKDKGKRRHTGPMGAEGPARVFPGKIPQPGQLGFQRRTELNKQVLKMGSEGVKIKGGLLRYGDVPGDFIMLKGSVPGTKKRLIMLRKGLRAPKKETVDIKHISLESQQ